MKEILEKSGIWPDFKKAFDTLSPHRDISAEEFVLLCDDTDDLIESAFAWGATKQGFKFWLDVKERLKNEH